MRQNLSLYQMRFYWLIYYATKENPDMAELIRGKVGRTTGHLMSMLVTLKGLPLAYNKDMQEDKEGLFDAVHTLKGSLRIFEGMVASMKVNSNRLSQTVKMIFQMQQN